MADAFVQGFVTQAPNSGPTQPIVQTGTLEFGPVPLTQQIQQFAEGLISSGVSQLDILPLFLLAGTHVMEDIPAAVTTASQQLGPQIQLRLGAHLGAHPRMVDVWRDRLPPDLSFKRVLVAHGSRYPGGNVSVEQLAAQLGAVPAYWLGGPTLETCVAELASDGHRQIVILPYFLFEGGITDALKEQINQLKWKFNSLDLKMLAPLEPSLEMAGLLLDLI